MGDDFVLVRHHLDTPFSYFAFPLWFVCVCDFVFYYPTQAAQFTTFFIPGGELYSLLKRHLCCYSAIDWISFFLLFSMYSPYICILYTCIYMYSPFILHLWAIYMSSIYEHVFSYSPCNVWVAVVVTTSFFCSKVFFFFTVNVLIDTNN